MSKSFKAQSESLASYAEKTFHPTDLVLQSIVQKIEQEKLPPIQVGSMDGLHLEVLVRAFQVKKAVEIGTLAGYSGVCIARGLLPGGKLWSLDNNERFVQVAKDSFVQAGVQDQVEIVLGEALNTLPQLVSQGPFDLVFIDADKQNYPQYLEWARHHLKKGGVVLADNTFAWGCLEDPKFKSDPVIQGIAKFNQIIANSDHWRATLLPTGEGLTLGVKQ